MLCGSSPEECIPSLSCSLPVTEHTQLICTRTYIHIYFFKDKFGRGWQVVGNIAPNLFRA